MVLENQHYVKNPCLVRSQDKICLVCASTAIEEEDRDEDTVIECQVSETKNPKRMELLIAAHVIVWDEFPSNHKRNFFEQFTSA